MVQTNISVDPDKWEALKELAAKHRVPVAVLVRDGLDRVLPLAEKQQATIEQSLLGRRSQIED